MDNFEYKPDKFESLISQHFQASEPDPGFLAHLKSSLLTPAAEAERTRFPKWSSMNWCYALTAALLLIIGAVALIGPARVWAQIESWIAYLPGLGSVELSGTRILEEPVAHSEAGITFHVEQFVASPDETLISILITGLPDDVLPSTGSIYVQWDDPDGKRQGVAMRKVQCNLAYPPCPSEGCPSDIQPEGYAMLFVYEPLPPDVNQVQIEWLTYGIVPGVPPVDFWTLDISLAQISEENAQDLIQPGYSLLSSEDLQHGVKIAIDQVFLGRSRTVIDASVLVPESAGQPNPYGLSLSTDKGDLLEPIYPSNDLDLNGIQIQTISSETPGDPAFKVYPTRWQFGPIDPQVSQLTLSIGSIDLYHNVEFQFEVETGQNPEVGTVIPLDVSFEVDGFPLHINQARIVMVPEPTPSVTIQVQAIEFNLDSPLSADGKSLRAIWFRQYSQVFLEPIIDREQELSIGRLALDPATIRDGKVKVAVDSAVLAQQGPWVISWDVPGETQ